MLLSLQTDGCTNAEEYGSSRLEELGKMGKIGIKIYNVKRKSPHVAIHFFFDAFPGRNRLG